MTVKIPSNQQFAYVFYKSVDLLYSQAPIAIDVWAMRVNGTYPGSLPKNTGRVFVWDELFWRDRPFDDQIRGVLKGIKNYLDPEPHSNSSYRCHLDTTDNLAGTISDLLQPQLFGKAVKKIALIDLGSTGPTPLMWSDIIPSLRNNYDLVIGFASMYGRGFSDEEAFFESSYWTRHSYEMFLCDIVCLTSDGLLGFNYLDLNGDRAPHIQNLIVELIETFRSTTNEIIRKVSSRPIWCAIAPRKFLSSNNKIPDSITYQADIIRQHFCDPDHSGPFEAASVINPIETGKIILWPLQTRLPTETTSPCFEPIGMRRLDES
jgi:hypothetical protein